MRRPLIFDLVRVTKNARLVHDAQVPEVHIAPVHDVRGPASMGKMSNTFTSCSRVWGQIAALGERNDGAQSNRLRHKSMVLLTSA